jgi:hypothetical protein
MTAATLRVSAAALDVVCGSLQLLRSTLGASLFLEVIRGWSRRTRAFKHGGERCFREVDFGHFGVVV